MVAETILPVEETPEVTPVLEETPEPTEAPEETLEPTEVLEETPEPTEAPEETPEPTEEPEETPEPVEAPEETPEPTEEPEETPEPVEEPEDTPEPTKKPSSGTGNYGKGIEGLIAAAESRLGCPYERAAKGPDSFDCSGFVYWCLKQAGAKTSYMTSVRWRTCSKYRRIESMDQLKRGDILVFSGSSESTGHVGIYMGGGRMIDASSSGGCVVIRSSIYSEYWSTHFLMGYRIWE